jgi:hypothetical protein
MANQMSLNPRRSSCSFINLKGISYFLFYKIYCIARKSHVMCHGKVHSSYSVTEPPTKRPTTSTYARKENKQKINKEKDHLSYHVEMSHTVASMPI